MAITEEKRSADFSCHRRERSHVVGVTDTPTLPQTDARAVAVALLRATLMRPCGLPEEPPWL